MSDRYFLSDKFLFIDYWEIQWEARQFFYAQDADNQQEPETWDRRKTVEKFFKNKREKRWKEMQDAAMPRELLKQ